jgi:hypothetical protein
VTRQETPSRALPAYTDLSAPHPRSCIHIEPGWSHFCVPLKQESKVEICPSRPGMCRLAAKAVFPAISCLVSTAPPCPQTQRVQAQPAEAWYIAVCQSRANGIRWDPPEAWGLHGSSVDKCIQSTPPAHLEEHAATHAILTCSTRRIAGKTCGSLTGDPVRVTRAAALALPH